MKTKSKDRKTDFSMLPIGTRVWSATAGWGTIIPIKDGSDYKGDYPIFVDFKNSTDSFSRYGKLYETDMFPNLFLNSFKIPDSAYISPTPPLKVDDKLEVWMDGPMRGHKYRYFSHWSGNKVVCFLQGGTSWSAQGETAMWDNYRVV